MFENYRCRRALRRLQSPKVADRVAAVRALAGLGLGRSLDPIRQAVQDTDSTVRSAAILSLVKLGTAQAIEAALGAVRGASELTDIVALRPWDHSLWERVISHPLVDESFLADAAERAPVDLLGRILIHTSATEAIRRVAQDRIDDAARRQAEEEALRAQSSDDYDDCGCNSPGYGCTHR